jgi:hypothetical protein
VAIVGFWFAGAAAHCCAVGQLVAGNAAVCLDLDEMHWVLACSQHVQHGGE